MKFEIGQEIWFASFEFERDYLTCPDCGGTCVLKVTIFDGTEYTIPCEGCSRGYEGSKGYLVVYKRTPRASLQTITGVEISDGKTEWRTTNHYHPDEEDLCLTEAEAQARAEAKAVQLDAEERIRLLGKEKPARSWAWHVHYHRREIKEAERKLVYHTSKLVVVRAKSKEPEIPS